MFNALNAIAEKPPKQDDYFLLYNSGQGGTKPDDERGSPLPYWKGIRYSWEEYWTGKIYELDTSDDEYIVFSKKNLLFKIFDHLSPATCKASIINKPINYPKVMIPALNLGNLMP